MSESQIDAGTDDDSPARRPRSLLRWIVAIGVAFAALIVGVVLLARSRAGEDGPWCVWAAPKPSPGMPRQLLWDDVRDAPGGASVGGRWMTLNQAKRPGDNGVPQIDAIGRNEEGLARVFAGSSFPSRWWAATNAQRSAPDGTRFTAFVRTDMTRPPAHLTHPASFAGVWEIDDGSGTAERLEFREDGTVSGRPRATWGVADGALVFDPDRDGDVSQLRSYVPSADFTTLDGNTGSFDHGTLLRMHGKRVK